MQTDVIPAGSKVPVWIGLILSGIVGAFMLLDAGMKLAKLSFVVKATTEMGFSEGVIVPLGAVLLTCTVLYLIPRTTILGAILLTGYLGGAVETHVYHGDGWFKILFPTVFGALAWGGLCLRDPRLRALVFKRT